MNSGLCIFENSENHNAGSVKSDHALQSFQYWEEKTDGYVKKIWWIKDDTRDVIKASHCSYISGAENLCILYQILNAKESILLFKHINYNIACFVKVTQI